MHFICRCCWSVVKSGSPIHIDSIYLSTAETTNHVKTYAMTNQHWSSNLSNTKINGITGNSEESNQIYLQTLYKYSHKTVFRSHDVNDPISNFQAPIDRPELPSCGLSLIKNSVEIIEVWQLKSNL